MNKIIVLVSLLLYVPIAYTKKGSVEESITCKYFGKTPTGSTIGSIDFANIDKANNICDPLSASSAPTPENGLLGRLIQRTANMGAEVNSVMDYLYKGQWFSQKIFFADVNVPTRKFTEGFVTMNGELIKDIQGNKLTQDFAIEYSSTLQLSAIDKPGEYEIALISDDGARLFVNENDTWNEIVNNDGAHLTRMGCPYRTIHMDKNSKLDIKLVYFQGNGPSVANVMLWRRHKHPQSWSNPSRHGLCGFQGDNFFFNSKKKTTLAMKLLKERNWNILSSGNFKMPESVPNPCVKLAISNFSATAVQTNSAVLVWSTSLPATSQLRILNAFTGQTFTTPLDANLVTEHEVMVSGLTRGVIYRIQAISTDSQGNTVITDPLVVFPK